MKISKKVQAALRRRTENYDSAPSGSKYHKVSDSPNRNQQMHKPGSQNRKKGAAVERGKKKTR